MMLTGVTRVQDISADHLERYFVNKIRL